MPPDPTLPEALLQAAQTALALVDDKGALVWWNRAFSQISGDHRRSPQDFLTELLPPNGRLELRPVAGSGLRLVEIASPGGPELPTPEGSKRDSLTGVLAREAFADELDQAFVAAEAKPFALLFIDLDDFKEINDGHGHLVGDDCLRVIGDRLSSVVRGGDAVGRFGGDEFLILLRGVAEAPLLRPIEARLREALCEPIEGPSGPFTIGVSLGAAYARDGYGSPAEMVAAADKAMYRDKRTSGSPES